MKKLTAMILSLVLILSLFAGCGAQKEDYDFKVAIVQQLSHSSLDEIRTAIEGELNAYAESKGLNIFIKVYNGNNDPTVLNQFGAEIVADDYDLIIPIASLAAQCMVTATEDTDIPIVFAAVSDPASVGLEGLPNVTGTSDALNTAFVLDMMLAVQPDVQTVGLLYSLSETNSLTPIAEAKDYLDAKGIAYIESTGNDNAEINAAAVSLVGDVDAVFTPTDNRVMSAEVFVAETLNEAGIPHYTGADSFVTSGAFATCGVNYTQLGEKTAQMAIEILEGGEIGAYQLMEGGIITVNTETAAALNLDYSAFAAMGTVVEVTTAAE